MRFQTKTQKITATALLAAVGLLFSYVEAIIPVTLGMPGVKLGIANLVVLVTMYSVGNKEALSINIIRIIVAGLLFNGVFGGIYALTGAIFSFSTMVMMKRTNLFSMAGVSMAGGVMHNFGQLIVAALIIENLKIFAYFPVLIFSGLIAGAILGILGTLIVSRVDKILKN